MMDKNSNKRQKSDSKKVELLTELTLNQISGLHPRAKKLILENPYPSLASISEADWPREVILTLLKLHPIIIRRTENKIECVGNIRMYQISCKFLQLKDTVSVLEVRSRLNKEIDKLYWAENLLLPIITDLGPKRHLRLHEYWGKFKSLEVSLWKNTPFDSIKSLDGFAKLIRVNKTRLTKKELQ